MKRKWNDDKEAIGDYFPNIGDFILEDSEDSLSVAVIVTGIAP